MVKMILWDNDGILVDTESLYFEASRQTLAEVGILLSREDFISISLRRGASVFELAQRQGHDVAQLELLRARRNQLYSALLAQQDSLVLPGVRETLGVLRNHHAMAVVTSSLRHHFELIHNGQELLSFMDFVLTREDYARGKPDPDPYLEALQRSGLSAEKCVAVEDTERGVAAAVAAGIACVAIPGAWNRDCDFSQAAAVLEDIREVPELLRSW